jgi:hypothetical protein
MADIQMCQDNECPKRSKCYRYTAKPTWYWVKEEDGKQTIEFHQTYYSETPRKSDDSCTEFYSIK